MILAQFTWRMRSLSLPDLFVLPTKKSLPGILRTEPWRCHFSPPWLCRNNSGLQGTEEGPRFRASRYRWNLVVVGVPRRPNGLGGSHGVGGWWLKVRCWRLMIRMGSFGGWKVGRFAMIPLGACHFEATLTRADSGNFMNSSYIFTLSHYVWESRPLSSWYGVPHTQVVGPRSTTGTT